MAISSVAVWEARASGDTANGGFFVPGSGGTDYSQQDSAQLALSDIATDGAGTGLSSATGGFTAAMVGNGIYLTGGGTTAGWYEITAHTDTNNVTIDRSAGASKTGVTGNVGGALFLQSNTQWNAPNAGNTVWIKAGTYVLTSNITLTTGIGSESLRLSYRGYNTTRGDDPQGTNRPYINEGAYYFTGGNYTDFWNLRMDGTAVVVFRVAFNGYVRNCKFQNTSGTADRDAADTGNSGGTYVDCEFICDNGYGLHMEHNGCRAVNCYIHDCGTAGIYVGSTSGYSQTAFCIVDTCVIGILGTTSRAFTCLNTVLYNNSSYGVQCTTADDWVFLNCAFVSNGTAIAFTDGHEGENWEDNCNFYNNSTKFSNFGGTGLTGTNSIAVDPQFINAPSGDFRIESNSGMLNAGVLLRLGVG